MIRKKIKRPKKGVFVDDAFYFTRVFEDHVHILIYLGLVSLFVVIIK